MEISDLSIRVDISYNNSLPYENKCILHEMCGCSSSSFMEISSCNGKSYISFDDTKCLYNFSINCSKLQRIYFVNRMVLHS